MTQREVRPIKKFSEEWWAAYARPENRCVAHRKNGNQCLKPARRGTTVCRFHGGAAPQVKAKARERLELAADRMARELLGIATGAESEAVKLSAVKDALDRAGLSAKTEVAVEVKAPWEELLGDVAQITRAQHEAMKRGELLPAPAALPPADVLDAEVVEQEHTARPASSTEGHADRPTPPEWAEPPARSATGQLVDEETATAEVARTRVSQTHRKRR